MEVQWNKRWFDGYYVSRNRRCRPSDWHAYNVTAPADSRLPDGGGYPMTGLHDITPTKFGLSNYRCRRHPTTATSVSYWSGVDVTMAMRAAKGLTFQGGTSTGQTVQDLCSVSNAVPDALLAPQAVAIGVSIAGVHGLYRRRRQA